MADETGQLVGMVGISEVVDVVELVALVLVAETLVVVAAS